MARWGKKRGDMVGEENGRHGGNPGGGAVGEKERRRPGRRRGGNPGGGSGAVPSAGWGSGSSRRCRWVWFFLVSRPRVTDHAGPTRDLARLEPAGLSTLLRGANLIWHTFGPQYLASLEAK